MTKKSTKPPAIIADDETVKRAIQDLGINRPYYSCRVVGARLEFSLYGGDLVYWPPKPARKPAPKKRSSP